MKMLPVFLKDSKGQERSLLVSGFVKPSGTRVGRVVNDRGGEYFPWIKPDGSFGCRQCPSEGKRKCYHVKALEQAELPTFEQLAGPLASYDVHREASKVLADAVIGDTYEQLAPTKRVLGASRSHVCGHLVPAGKEWLECGACLDRLFY